jgi:UDP-N-acetylglucosamine transferase subunit ALG13
MTTFIAFGNLDKKFPSMVDSIILAEGKIPIPVVIQAGANIDSFLHYSVNSNYIVFDFCSNDDYINYVRNSSLIISHAGVGAINTALSFWKKPIIFARRCGNRDKM